MKAYFISDVHIMSSQDARLPLLTNVVSTISKDATHIGLLGDIFDLWIADHEYFAKKYSGFVEAVKSAVDRGVEVHYIEGNHDFHLKKFWEEKIGARVHEEEHFIESDGIRIRLEHGDFINPDDRAYLIWRKFIRSSFMNFMTHNAPGTWVEGVGEYLSRQSKKRSRVERTPEVDLKIEKSIEKYSLECAGKYDFDYLVFGHVHLQKEFTFTANGRKRKSINLGYWDSPKTYLITPEESKFLYF
ncbi:MAG: UDP-2,3-diacylglucosamine diphosphatase [Bdellovibrionales bacterium]|nr:UDP-2,3-diacylglucosamine diphosphatase [Bdellovibrionales bacterium]